MQITPSVRAVQVPEEDPGRPVFTNIFMVGNGQVLTIDSGEAIDKFRWMIKGYLAAVERAEIALAGISHHHWDHAGNLKWVRSELGAEIIVPRPGVPLLKGFLPGSGVQKFDDGKVIELDGGIKVRVIFTPGHSTDSVCYYIEDEGVLFTGDTLLGSSTTIVFDLATYRESLAKLVALPNLKVICPGHGAIVWDPRERLQMYVDHRNMRERQILEVLTQGGPWTSWDIMMKLYTDINPRLRRGADANVRAHLTQLEQEGRLTTYAGKPRKTSAAKQVTQMEHARVRNTVIRQARKYEAQGRRATVRAQESPPTEMWIEAPRYELS
jgi:glyoxylase-like metal-dependent hydrolase (beta-lactamase superfamily II)